MSGEFNSQHIANTLWAYATLGTRSGEGMMGQLEERTEAISGEFKAQEIHAMHQIFISCDIMKVMHAGLSETVSEQT